MIRVNRSCISAVIVMTCSASAAAAQTGAPTSGREAATPTTPSPTAAVVRPGTDAQAVAVATDGPANQLQEIVVTAQKRSENQQRVPIAVTSIGAADLEARNLTSVTDLGGAVPGLQFQKFNGLVLPFLRGVGQTGVAAGNESSVAVYVDGVYFSRLASGFFDLRNVDRVEVLKGPQGTLFGRNSTGGVINILTRDPSFETRLSGSVGYGRFNTVQGDAYYTTPLSDKVAVDLSVSGRSGDGFGRNVTTGARYGYEDAILGRARLLFKPTEDTKVLLAGFYSYSRSSPTKAPFPGTATGSPSQPFYILRSTQLGFYNSADSVDSGHRFDTYGGSLRIEHTLSFARFTSLTAYSRTDERSVFDGDYGPRDDIRNVLAGPTKLFTQEFQLASGPGGPLDWIAGLYYYNNATGYSTFELNGPLVYGPAGLTGPSKQHATSYAAFAQATYEVAPGLKLTGGLRYTRDRTSASGFLAVNSDPPVLIVDTPDGLAHVNRFTYRGAVAYQFTGSTLGYASYSRGFKSGNFNLLPYTSNQATKPEVIDAYETGLKTELFDRRLRFNGALFWYDIKNPQVELASTTGVFFSNAGSSRIKGGEFEAQAILLKGLTARASFTYQDGRYRRYDNAPSYVPDQINGGSVPIPGGIDAAGNRTPLAAKATFDVGGDYVFNSAIGEWSLTADLIHNSGYFFEPNNFLHQGSYDLVNAQVRLAVTPHLAVRVYGRNLNGAKFIAAAGTVGGFQGYQYLPGPPRTYGFAVDFDF